MSLVVPLPSQFQEHVASICCVLRLNGRDGHCQFSMNIISETECSFQLQPASRIPIQSRMCHSNAIASDATRANNVIVIRQCVRSPRCLYKISIDPRIRLLCSQSPNAMHFAFFFFFLIRRAGINAGNARSIYSHTRIHTNSAK